MEYKNNYPIVIIHGLLGWGEADGIDEKYPHFGLVHEKDLTKYLQGKGIEVYRPSVGPINSAWDRTCVLWAYLFGGRVDYGKVHSQKYGHARYGKEYPGVLKDLGQNEAHKKINLIGHSFGGPTVKTAAWLFAFGSEEERNGTPPEELSPLFAGGHGDLLHTVTTLSGVNNGTTLASLFGRKPFSVVNFLLCSLVVLIGDTPVTKTYDFSFAQWGLMPNKEEVRGWNVRNPLRYFNSIRAFDRNKTFDNVNHEMQVEVIQKTINPSFQYPTNAYYFAQRADGTIDDGKGGRKPNRDEMSLLFWTAGWVTGKCFRRKLAKYGVFTDPNWAKNDGCVNVPGQTAPFNARQEEADYDTDFKPGIWYNMPVERGDHVIWMGWRKTKEEYFAMFDRMIDLYRKLPDGDTEA